jgi:hypothetical protein
VGKFLYHFKNGLKWGYPMCCSLRWSIRAARGHVDQARQRGVCCKTRGNVWVPCGWLHSCDYTFTEWTRQVARWKVIDSVKLAHETARLMVHRAVPHDDVPSRDTLFAALCVYLAPYAAELVVYGAPTSESGPTLSEATCLAEAMSRSYGMQANVTDVPQEVIPLLRMIGDVVAVGDVVGSEAKAEQRAVLLGKALVTNWNILKGHKLELSDGCTWLPDKNLEIDWTDVSIWPTL